MSREKAESLATLLRLQPYISAVEFSDKRHDTDGPLDGFRSHLGGGRNLADAHLAALGKGLHGRQEPWLSVPDPVHIADVIIHRSPRYHGHLPWKRIVEKYAHRIAMVGSKDEHDRFCREFGHVPYVRTETFLELARVIAGSKLFIGNQSSPEAVAEGLKHPKLLEVSGGAGADSCIFRRAGAIYVPASCPFVELPEIPAAGIVARQYAGFYAPKANVGDLIVEAGARQIVRAALGSELEQIKAVWVIGTPWFWDHCAKSPKYDWLRTLIERHEGKRPLVALGVGANVVLGKDHTAIRESKDECARLWRQFALVTVRDEVASRFLDSIGVPHILLPCPSLFALQSAPERCSGTVEIDAPLWNDTLKPARLPRLPGARTVNYPNGRWTPEAMRELLTDLAKAESIVSARVHAAIPLSPFRKVSIVPMDSRSKTASLVGIPEYPSFSEPAKVRQVRERAMEDYSKALAFLTNARR
jgi:hypothetical protein